MANKYMHLLGGKPACFYEDEQSLLFPNQGVSLEQMLVDSLATIRKQRQADLKTHDGDASWQHSYLRVKVD